MENLRSILARAENLRSFLARVASSSRGGNKNPVLETALEIDKAALENGEFPALESDKAALLEIGEFPALLEIDKATALKIAESPTFSNAARSWETALRAMSTLRVSLRNLKAGEAGALATAKGALAKAKVAVATAKGVLATLDGDFLAAMEKSIAGMERVLAESEPLLRLKKKKKPKIKSTLASPGDLGNTAGNDTERSSGVEALLEREELPDTEPASTWASEKKPKIQSTFASPVDLGNTAGNDTERSSGVEALLEREEAADTEPASAWASEKKPKIEITLASPGDLGNTAGNDTERSSCMEALLEREEVADTEPESACASEKKPKIQSRLASPGDLGNTAGNDTERSSGEIIHGHEQEQDEIEGLNWDGKKLSKKIDGLRQLMEVPSHDDDYASAHNDEIWAHFNEEQQAELNQRLALCRIRAHEKQYRALDDASLLKLFPPSVLEDNEYYDHYECHFDWFFDPTYCKYAHVEDYQRLVLRVTVDFEGLEICPYTRHTLADDQQFVQFWEKLSRKTKLIELYITERSCEDERQRIENLLLYHALKIAEEFPSVYKTPIVARFYEFVWGVEADYTFAGFLTKMWELLAKKQMNFKDALWYVYNEGKYRSIFLWGMGSELEPNLFPMEQLYKPHLDRIVEKAQDDTVHQLVMDTIVENFWKPRRYYDYVRKKMRIAEEIGLIPKQPPHKLYTPGCYRIWESSLGSIW